MPSTKKISRTQKFVYVLVFCALVIAFVVTTQAGDISHSVKDLALRGRTQDYSTRTFPPDLSVQSQDLQANIRDMEGKAPTVVEPKQVGTEASTPVPGSDGNVLNSVTELPLATESPKIDLVEPTMAMPHNMLLPLKNLQLNDAIPVLSIPKSSEAVTEPPTTEPTASAHPYVPLSLHVPVGKPLRTSGAVKRGSPTLEELHLSHWREVQGANPEDALGDASSEQPSARSVKMLNEFHSALKYGQICSDGAVKDLRRTPASSAAASSRSFSMSKASSPKSDTAAIIRAAIREVMSARAALFIEYSRLGDENPPVQSASFLLSSAHPVTTSILLDSSTPTAAIQSPSSRECVMDRLPDMHNPPSNVLVTRPWEPDAAISGDWDRSFDCVQMVTSFNALFSPETDPLPFDMEDTLGKALCRCNVTLLPSRLPSTPFFSYWEDVEMLVAEAVASTKGACAVTVNSSSVFATSSSSSFDLTKYRSSSSSSSLSSKHVYVYRQDPSLRAISPLPASTVMRSQLHPSSRMHLMASVLMAHEEERDLSHGAINKDQGSTLDHECTREMLNKLLSLDLSQHNRRRHSSSSAEHVEGGGGNKHYDAKSTSAAESSSSSSYKSHSSFLHSSSNSKSSSGHYQSGHSTPSPQESHTGADSGSSLKDSGHHKSNALPNFTQSLSEPDVTPSAKLNSLSTVPGNEASANVTDIDRVSVRGSRRALLTYSYLPKSTSSSPSDTSASTSDIKLSIISAAKSPSFSSSSKYSSSKSSSNSTSSSKDSASSSSTPPTEVFREPVRSRSHFLPSLSYSFWSTASQTARADGDELDRWIAEQAESKKMHRDDIAHDQSRDPARKPEQLSWTSRLQQKALRRREDRFHHKRWIAMLRSRPEFKRVLRQSHTRAQQGKSATESSSAAYPLVYVFGRYSTMLSVRLAQMLSSRKQMASTSTNSIDSGGLVVSLLSDSQSWEPHRELLDTMGLHNNLVAYQKLSVPLITALLAAPELADVLILQGDIFVEVAHLAIIFVQTSDEYAVEDKCMSSLVLFEDLMASLLGLAENVYMEIPDIHILHAVFYGLSSECYETVLDQYMDAKQILQKIGSRVQIPANLNNYQCSKPQAVEEDPDNETSRVQPGEEEECLHIHFSEVNEAGAMQQHADDISTDKNFSSSLFHVTVKVQRHSLQGENSHNIGLSASKLMHGGISLYTILHFNVEPSFKRMLFKLYLEIPFHVLDSFEQQLVVPSNIFAKVVANPDEPSPAMRFVTLSLIHPSVDESERGEDNSGTERSYHRSLRQVEWTMSTAIGDVQTARAAADTYWHALNRELHGHPGEVAEEGRFSFVEHNSDFGFVSYQLAKKYPNATVVSLESNQAKASQHVKMVTDLKVLNNVVCNKMADSDSIIFKNIYESPELFRFQLIARGILEAFGDSTNVESWGRDLGSILSSALTTFVSVPSSAQVSLAMTTFMCCDGNALSGPFRPLSDVYGHTDSSVYADSAHFGHYSVISNHPLPVYRGFETVWLMGSSRVEGGSTQLALTPIFHDTKSTVPILIRCDIMNMTRHVHHHYNYAKDGHTRTYTMRVEVNRSESDAATMSVGDVSSTVPMRAGEAILLQSRRNSISAPTLAHNHILPLGMHPNQHNVVSVRLYRDKDSFPIPYTSIYGITLISILRLGLDSGQRERLFSSFLRLPLYEDMAPWNMVLMGEEMAYIDYDTRDMTFDMDVPKAYQVMSVLMNYKRTVEDFKRCGSKAPTVYGIGFISDCVGSRTTVKCSSLKLPVPCGDGQCHSDYISCLRALSSQAESFLSDGFIGQEGAAAAGGADDVMSRAIVEAMRSGIGSFDERGFGTSTR